MEEKHIGKGRNRSFVKGGVWHQWPVVLGSQWTKGGTRENFKEDLRRIIND